MQTELNECYAMVTVTPYRKEPRSLHILSGTWLSRGCYGVYTWLLRGLRPALFRESRLACMALTGRLYVKTCVIVAQHKYVTDQGRIQDFHWGGGGEQKIMCVYAHHEREARSPLRLRSRARLRALEALFKIIGFLMLSLMLSEPYFEAF